MNSLNLDKVRGAALSQIEKSQKIFFWGICGVAVVESFFLLGFLKLADFSNKTHILLLLCTIATYSIIGVGLFTLGAYINRCIGRVLLAVESLEESKEKTKK
ncbi:MAG: hypothetical protein JNN15_04995 [Blastocatellia bacterium]|nr:hypothetical protein [Blastocatellia bacterium]